MSLARWERVLLGSAAACLLAAVLARPIAALVSPAYVVWSACPLDEEDLEFDAANQGPFGIEIDDLRGSGSDSWGRPLRFKRTIAPTHTWVKVYSVGPNGVDSEGQGDDVPLRFPPAFEVVAWTPAWLPAVAALLLWVWGVARLLGAPRSESLPKEVVRAAGIATLPTALGSAALFAIGPENLKVLAPIHSRLPLPFAGGFLVGFVSLVVALGLRHRSGLSVETPDAVRPRRRARSRILALLVVLVLVLVGTRGASARAAARAHDRIVAGARIGLPRAVGGLFRGNDLEALRTFVKAPPRGFSFRDRGPNELRSIARLGSDAVPALLDAVAFGDNEVGGGPFPDHACAPLREVDPHLRSLARAFAERPRAYVHLFLDWPAGTDAMRAAIPRRCALAALAGLLDDEMARGAASYFGRGVRVCDDAANVIAAIVDEDHDFALPVPPASDGMDRRLERVRAWWLSVKPEPRLPPRGWVVVNARNQRGGTLMVSGFARQEGCQYGIGSEVVIGPLPCGPTALQLRDVNVVAGKETTLGSLPLNVTVAMDEAVWLDVDFATGRVDVK